MQHSGIELRGRLADCTITDIAIYLQLARPNVSNTLNGRFRITPKFALKVERVFEISAQELVMKQAMYDLHLERLKQS